MFEISAKRVPEHTESAVQARIERDTKARIAYFEKCGDPREIEGRLNELDREWDIERAIEMNAASLALAGVLLGLTRGKQWFLLPLAVTGFLLQHAVQGWCPPVPVLRRLGFRTRHEIDRERMALKAIRGDFRDIPDAQAEGSRGDWPLMEAVDR